MADPTKYVPGFSYSGYQAVNPKKPLPADEVDNDFANVSQSVNQTIDALKDIRRSDGKLKNQSVGPDQLSPALTIGFTFEGTWVDGRSYSVGDGVVYGSGFYSARTTHTADVSNAPGNSAYWNYLFSLDDIVVEGGMSLPRDSFVGDGTTTAFTLSFVPLSKFNVFVQIGGVVQTTDAYAANGNTLTFVSPPPNGYGIEVRGFATTATLVTPEDGSVTTPKLADQSVTEEKLSVTVAGKLNGAVQNYGSKAAAAAAIVPTTQSVLRIDGVTDRGFWTDVSNGATGNDTFTSSGGTARTFYKEPFTEVGFWSDYLSNPLWPFGRTAASMIRIGEGAAASIQQYAAIGDIVAIGPGALNAATGGTNLIAVGGNTMSQAQPGPHNIAFGNSALTHVDGSGGGVDGSRNLAFGSLALHFLTSGAYNNMFGRDAGHAIKTGSRNSGFGYRTTGAAENPIGFDGKITQMWELSADGQSGFGMDALRYSDGEYNSGFGYLSLAVVKKGSRNAGFGAGALAVLDTSVSYGNKLLDKTARTGTYSQSGTTVTVSMVGVNAVVGNRVHVKFDSGAINAVTAEYIAVTVVTAPNANTFTFTSPVSQAAIGNCSSDWVETNTATTPSERNTAVGVNALTLLESGSRNVGIGEQAGYGQGTSYSDKLIAQVRESNVRPLIVGDFAQGFFTVNGNIADLDQPFAVNSTSGVRLFQVEASGFITRFLSDDATGNVGPVLALDRRSASPAANDVVGAIRFLGRDTVNSEVNYADIFGTLLDPTDGSEDAMLSYRTRVSGTIGARLNIGGGLFHPLATGGDKGDNTINYGSVYDDNALLTCYPIQAANTGYIDLDFWDEVSAFGAHAAARRFAAERMEFLDVDRFIAFWRTHDHLPTLPSPDEWRSHAKDKMSVGQLIQALWETVDVMAVHIAQIRDERKAT